MCHKCTMSKYNGIFSRVSSAVCGPLACGSWLDAEGCGLNIRERWENRGKLTCAQSKKWERTHCQDVMEFRKLTKRVWRKGGYNLAVHHDDDSFTVTHTARRSTRQFTENRTKWLSSKAAFKLFAQDIAAIPATACDHRRVTCSRNCPQPEKRKANGWKIEAITTKSIQALNDKLRRLLIPFTIRKEELFRSEYVAPLLDRPFDPALSDISCGNELSSPTPLQAASSEGASVPTRHHDHGEGDAICCPACGTLVV